MRRSPGPAAFLVAAALCSASPAHAEPTPVPPPPPALVGADPSQILGPLDHLAPITLLDPGTYRMPDGSQPSPYVLTEGAPPGPFATIEEWKGLHAMLHGALGRMPGAELGTALPGTAPAPGTSLPPGLEEFLPTAAPTPPAPPA